MKVIKFPNAKLSKRERYIRNEAEHWYNNGFAWDVSVAVATVYSTVDRLERRIKRLEGKPIKNSTRHKSKRIRNNVVLLRDHQK